MNKSKKAIIVGASSGIGKALVRELVKYNYSVGITGRRDALLLKLQKEHPEQIHYVTSDCTKSYALKDIEKLTKQLGGLDLFIISAGRGTINLKLDFDLEDQINKLNVIAFTNLVNWGMLFFEKQGYGHLANISSVASQRGGGLAPAYHASKAYQASYLEGMAQRAAHSKSNIDITDIRPGFVRTPMLQGKKMFWTSTKEKAAVQIIKAIKRKKRIVYITKRWRFAAWVFRKTPWFIFKKM